MTDISTETFWKTLKWDFTDQTLFLMPNQQSTKNSLTYFLQHLLIRAHAVKQQHTLCLKKRGVKLLQ